MRSTFVGRLFIVAAMVASALLLATGTVSAHERRDISKYQFTVGFFVEPPIEGQKNGVDLRVVEKEGAKPVEGLEKTLQVEITHLPIGTSKVFKLRAVFRDPGHYTNDLLLTAPGQYRLRFFGDIAGTQVNETFLSGPGRFNDVESSAELQFPERLPEVREIAAAVRGSQASSQQARDSVLAAQAKASSATTLAIIGIALGVIGTALGAGAVVMARRRR